ncbi:hypothetical protein BDR07DRAFT_1391045 [Suillus spraguei]|nr:hypothetical protein BDR07DRAFT_1391045 [Suillus spraguei]
MTDMKSMLVFRLTGRKTAATLHGRGHRMDTVRDVKDHYEYHCGNTEKRGHSALARSEDALCKDMVCKKACSELPTVLMGRR